MKNTEGRPFAPIMSTSQILYNRVTQKEILLFEIVFWKKKYLLNSHETNWFERGRRSNLNFGMSFIKFEEFVEEVHTFPPSKWHLIDFVQIQKILFSKYQFSYFDLTKGKIINSNLRANEIDNEGKNKIDKKGKIR